MTDFKHADVLERAADYIEAHGKCKHAFKYGGMRCAVGAIAEVTGAIWEKQETVDGGWAFQGGSIDGSDEMLRVFVGTDDLTEWSDRLTGTQVVARMRACAHSLRGDSTEGQKP